ncbi:hypothetical protein FRC03_009257 [Tulasnella sp. 419]|nr:hypothetical protein FRC02_005082 [Tulasnella sp. 418]KAG8958311.1 hypothetical protein FRC03_009257 [Tulasnella sp. 419]
MPHTDYNDVSKVKSISQPHKNEPKWEKVLWKKQPFPDNYVPPSFLSSLKRNSNVRSYSYLPLVCVAFAVTQHLSTIFILISTFIRLRSGALDPRYLIWLSIGFHPFGHIMWELLERTSSSKAERKKSRLKAVKSSILVFIALISISPVLKTLTEATSSDSIWAMAACLFFLNAMLADYSAATQGFVKERLTSVLSMNAAISASVVLASRLSSNLSVFALITFSVQLFALFPILRRRLQHSAPLWLRTLVTTGLVILAIGLFVSISRVIAILVTAILAFVTFACPFFFIWAQKYKNEIKGPWDPAVPIVR